MTKEQFALAAEGAGFVQNRFDPEIWYHPNAKDVSIWLEGDCTMKIHIPADADVAFPVSLPVTLQRITHLFKAFQP